MRKVILFVAVVVLSACNSVARQNAAVKQIEQDSSGELTTCRDKTYNNNAYSEIIKHYPQENILSANARQLSDNTKPNVRDKQLLAEMRNDVIPCRRLFLDRTKEQFPRKAMVYIQEWVANDDVTLKLSKGQLTWGQAVTMRQKIKADANNKQMQIKNQVDRSVDLQSLTNQADEMARPALTNW